MGHDVDLVVGEKLVSGFGREQLFLAPDADDNGAQRREEIGQLAKRRVQDRAILIELNAQKLGLAFKEHLGVEGRGRVQAAECRFCHFAFGADDDVDRQVIAPVEVGIDRGQIALGTQTGDLAGDVEDRMGHLAGDHVDLVRIGRGDDHVGIAGAGPLEHVGIACVARNALHIERVGGPAHEVGIVVDDGDIVAFAGQMPRDLPADLARAADDDLHGYPLAAPVQDCLARAPDTFKRGRSARVGKKISWR